MIAAPDRSVDTRLDDLNDRVKELVNEIRRLADIVDPPDLEPVKVTGNQPVIQAKTVAHPYFVARP